MMLRAICASGLLLLASCGSQSLEGSLGESLDLSFNQVEIRRNAQALQISYLRSDGKEVVARMTVVTEGLDLKSKVSLAGRYAAGHPRTVVTRAVDGEPLVVLPAVENGTLELSEDPAPDKVITGNFSLAFATSGGDTGGGRTLLGTFQGKVLAAQ